MRSEGLGILAFFLLMIGLIFIGVSEDYSRNARIKNEEEQKKAEQIARVQQQISQREVEQDFHRRGCAINLDGCIEKMIKEKRNDKK